MALLPLSQGVQGAPLARRVIPGAAPRCGPVRAVEPCYLSWPPGADLVGTPAARGRDKSKVHAQ
jgi:hypothetical protein